MNAAATKHPPASGHAPAPATLADDLHASPLVAQAVDTIVKEVRARSARITDVRGPASPAARQTYEDYMKRCADLRGRALLYPYIGSGLGHGALVELMDGSVKWDMICGIGVHFFGHSDPDLTAAALRGALGDTVMQGNLQANGDAYRFMDLLLKAAGRSSRLKHAYLSTSGCMANENALKVCYQKHAPASRVIAFKDCFMGRSVTMSQIGDAAANRIGLPLSTQVDYMPFYDPVAAARMGQGRYIDMCVSHLRQYIERYPRQHACFIFELVQGEGGFNTAPREYFTALMDVCKASGIAVWDDEIQSFGRTTSMFAYEALDLGDYVDVFCVGKMTQVCATLYTAEYNPGPGLLSGTFIGGSVPFAVGSRVLERLGASDFYGPEGRFARQHRAFCDQVRALAARRPEWFPRTGPCGEFADIVGGVGGMMRFTPFGGDKDKVMKACKALFDEGVIVFYCGHGPYHVRMLPPLGVFDERDWPRVFACVERGLAKVL
ncbi:MAG: aminotransferase class III-fold pyridoxal phosphate-dependent enzyme [Phycisphaeraceae bacterium]|nr:aminotransferase class III-fold pyridoxal phosphate-dependent enzyme [Phycisphaeraceae bacterium]